jgi:hypothetical protein
VNTQIEVIDTTAALTRAKGLYYRALHRHTTARLSLRKAMGVLTAEPGGETEPAAALKSDGTRTLIGETATSTEDSPVGDSAEAQ